MARTLMALKSSLNPTEQRDPNKRKRGTWNLSFSYLLRESLLRWCSTEVSAVSGVGDWSAMMNVAGATQAPIRN
jgi:hypothetical protein